MIGIYSEFWHNLIDGNLLVQEVLHGVFALTFALLVYKKTNSFQKAFLVILFTYVMDADHLFDYYMYFGFNFSLTDFLSAEYFKTGISYTPLHGWEWVILLGLVSIKKGWNSVFTILIFTIFPHLIFDSLTVGSFVNYSIIRRALVGFRIS